MFKDQNELTINCQTRYHTEQFINLWFIGRVGKFRIIFIKLGR